MGVYVVVARVIHTGQANPNNEIDLNLYPQGYVVSHKEYDEDVYDDNINSSLKMVNISTRELRLNFSIWELHKGECSDYLEISSNNSPQRLCGNRKPQTILISNAREVLLRFVTDDEYGDRGFMLRYDSKYMLYVCIYERRECQWWLVQSLAFA